MFCRDSRPSCRALTRTAASDIIFTPRLVARILKEQYRRHARLFGDIMRKRTLLRLTYSAVCLAAALVLPLVTGNVPRVGNMLCPMHIPVILCGFICGPYWAAAVGALAPLFRSVIFGAPVMLPMAVSMAFELAAYGAVSALVYSRTGKLGRSAKRTYVSLLCAMVVGRAVWGLVRVLLSVALAESFPISAFVAGAFTNAIPGIVLQLILIPLVVNALRRLPESGIEK